MRIGNIPLISLSNCQLPIYAEVKGSKFGEKHYVFITAYSTQSYIEIAILFPKVSINISLLTPKKEEAQKLVEMIIESLIS